MVLLRRNRLVITLSGNSFSNIHSNDSIGNSIETNDDRNVDFLLESWFGQNKQPFEDEANLISVEQRQASAGFNKPWIATDEANRSPVV